MVGKWDDKDKGERMIMKGKWKTRAMAFVMAFSMGMSSMISSSVYAAAEQPETKVETETQVFEEQTEEKVRAEDIVKDVSDKEFRVETSMEGISYDPERESVLLSEIKDQDGGSFQPENPGVYYAQYLVTPKDGSEPYMIGRTITLTDTEGLAHSESNGGEKQKEDTSSEEESEQPLPVEITSSQPEDTPDVLAELERDIEEGNVMMFSAADGMGKSETVHLNKGRTIYYPDYLGNYLTCLFTVNGKLAYCLESHRASPPTGDYVADILESNKNLQKVLYYGYGGAGDITGSYLSGKSDDEKYVYTHLAASYAYCGDLAFTGCPYENLVNAGVIAYINHLFGMEEPPKGELSFSNANVTAVREGDIQKTPDITLNGDHRNKITIPVPQGVTGYNKSKGTNVSGGNLEVYGGDTFYLQAPLTVTGKWESGQLYGSVRESWKTLVLTSTGGNNQDIGAFISEKAAPVSFDIQWLNLARVKILKKDAETGNPLDGAVYGVYKNSTCTDQLLTIAMTGEDGISYSDYFDAALETVYVKEITAPNGYAINKTVYPVHVSAGSSVEVEAVNTSVKGKITVKKQDVDTGDFLPQGDAKLDGAVYGLYAKEDIQKPDGTGVLYKAGSLIQEKTFGKSGEIVFENVYLGAMYVKEIAAPEGYLLDEMEYDATLIYEGQEKPIVVKALTVKEKVKKQAFQIIKISEDGDQTETDLVEGAEFTIYLVSNLSKVKDGTLKPGNGSEFTPEDFIGYDFTDEEVAVTYEDGKEIEVPVLVTDKKGYAKSVELPYGQYVVAETKTPENLKQVHPFLVTVNEDSRDPQEWRVFDDRPFEFMLKIIKKDAETDHNVLNNSATYKIWDFEKKAYVEQMVYYPEKEKISEFSTNADGYLILPEELKAGHYRIEEIQAPDGYVRQENVAITCGSHDYNMLNYKQVDDALSLAKTGENTETEFFVINTSGVWIYNKLQFKNKDLYVTSATAAFDDNMSPHIVQIEKIQVYDWNYTDKGWIIWEKALSRNQEMDMHVFYRILPLDEQCRELGNKCITPVSYFCNNLFLVDWNQNSLENIEFNDLFEFLYTMKYGEKIDEKKYASGIPKVEFEEVVTTYFDISIETLEIYAQYDDVKGVYPWEAIGPWNRIQQFQPFPEVVNCIENEDGSLTLTVEAVFQEEGTDCSFRHEVTIREEGDKWIYLGNCIEREGAYKIPEYKPRRDF